MPFLPHPGAWLSAISSDMTLLHPVKFSSTIPVACYVRSVRAYALYLPHRHSYNSETSPHHAQPYAISPTLKPFSIYPSQEFSPILHIRRQFLQSATPHYMWTRLKPPSLPSTHHFRATTPTCPHTLPTPPSLDLHHPQRNSHHPASLFCTYPLGLSSFRGLDLYTNSVSHSPCSTVTTLLTALPAPI